MRPIRPILRAAALTVLWAVASQAATLPLKNALLQSNLDAGGYSITNAAGITATNGTFDILTLDGFSLASLTNYVGTDPTDFEPALGYTPQVGSANLTNWSAIDTNVLGTLEPALGYTPQVGSANLTNWSALDTNVLGTLEPALGYTPQVGSANLTNWSALDTNVLGQLPYQQAHETLSNIVSTVTVDTNGNLTATTVSDQVGDFRDAITTVEDWINNWDGPLNNVTNPAVAFSGLDIEGPVSHRSDYYEGGTVSLDLGVVGDFNIGITNDTLSIAYTNRKDSTGRVLRYGMFITNLVDDIGSIEWGSATPTSIVPYDQIGPLEVAEFTISDRDGVLRYTYVGPQSEVLPPVLGGTGTTNAIGTAPYLTSFTPYITGLTNWALDFALGTRVIANLNTNAHLGGAGISGAPSAGERARQIDFVLSNTNSATGHITITSRSDISLVGFTNTTLTLSNGWSVGLTALASSNGLCLLQTTCATGVLGAGDPPAASPFDDAEFVLKFEEISGTTVADSTGNGYTFSEFGGVWTKNVAGIDGLSWTNTSVTRAPTNNAAALDVGLAGASFSFGTWLNPQSVAYMRIAGKWNEGAADDRTWCLRGTSSGIPQFQLVDSANAIKTVTWGSALTAGSWYWITGGFDNPSDLIWISVNGGTKVTAAAGTNNARDSSVATSIGGWFDNNAIESNRGHFDETVLWLRTLTQEELETTTTSWFAP